LAREIRYRLTRPPALDFETAASLPNRRPWREMPAIRTVFKNPDMFALTVDLDDPRIREGLRIGEAVLASLGERLAERGIRFVVVLIPDKVTGYQPIVSERRADIPEGFFRMERLESRVRAELSAFLAARGIETVDVTQAMQALLREGVAVYPESDDHHNSAAGYRLIAELVAASLGGPGERLSGPPR
jgi:hypothetical protein